MLTLTRVVTVGFASFSLMLTAYAGETGLSGFVKDSAGRPIQGAEIRIQGSDANRIGKIHTKANGYYNYPALEAGTYRVILLVNDVTKASINNVRTKAGETQSLNFEILKGSAAKPFAAGRHYVWIPNQTGSHLGEWMEVDDANGKEMPVGMQERMRWSGSSLAKQLQYNSAAMPNGQ